MAATAERLARWAHEYEPTEADRELAHRALNDTIAVTVAARDSRMRTLTKDLPHAARWAAVGHVLDFDDLHLPSTAHISVVCVPATLATGGRPRRLPFGDDQIIYFRTLSDYRRLRALTETGRRFAVIGGGFTGSEIAAALALNGKEVVMIFPDKDIGIASSRVRSPSLCPTSTRKKALSCWPAKTLLAWTHAGISVC